MPNTTIKPQAGAIEAPAALYVGDVMHARLKRIGHRFSYRVISLLIDLGRLDQADRQSPLFGVNRAALYSFHEADHGPRDASSLLLHIQRMRRPVRHRPRRRASALAVLSAAARISPSIRCRSIFAIAPTANWPSSSMRSATLLGIFTPMCFR